MDHSPARLLATPEQNRQCEGFVCVVRNSEFQWILICLTDTEIVMLVVDFKQSICVFRAYYCSNLVLVGIWILFYLFISRKIKKKHLIINFYCAYTKHICQYYSLHRVIFQNEKATKICVDYSKNHKNFHRKFYDLIGGGHTCTKLTQNDFSMGVFKLRNKCYCQFIYFVSFFTSLILAKKIYRCFYYLITHVFFFFFVIFSFDNKLKSQKNIFLWENILNMKHFSEF